MRSTIVLTVLVSLTAAVGQVLGSGVADAQPALPQLQVTPVLDGLTKPWDIARAPDGTLITGERGGQFVVKRGDGSVGTLNADLSDLYVGGETGLMGLSLSPNFAADRTVYTCQGHTEPGTEGSSASADAIPLFGTGSAQPGADIRVVSWKADPGWTKLDRVGTVISGLPIGAGGRHGGCRVLAAGDGTLWVGAGDSAQPNVPQNLRALGGKVLHINTNGSPAAGNPFAGSPVFSFGHRNPQGLAFQPGTGRLYAIEQGTDRDDEVNLIQAGGNYGYSPNRVPFIYDESVPMTDTARFPNAIPAVWSSGPPPTLATPGGTFVPGPGWGAWENSLVVTTQQAKKLIFLQLTPDGKGVAAQASALENQYGRLRSTTALGDGSFLLTTDNGGGADQVLLVRPAS